MKKTDIAMIILIASMSMLVSYFVVNAILGDSQSSSVNVKTIDPIGATVEDPDPRIFNDDAINPTVEVFIGEERRAS